MIFIILLNLFYFYCSYIYRNATYLKIFYQMEFSRLFSTEGVLFLKFDSTGMWRSGFSPLLAVSYRCK